jgi:preprotein translocase subunit SecA
MSSAVFPSHIGGLTYPERSYASPGKLDVLAGRLMAPIVRRWHARLGGDVSFLASINAKDEAVSRLRDEDLRNDATALRQSLAREGFTQPIIAHVFALVREAAHRTLGYRHFDVQLLAGRSLLRNVIVEMNTGEGKTLTATLPACTAALAGVPVHIVTVNDYLAARDAEEMGPLYRALGLTVGVIVQGLTPDARRAAYACDVTYCTNKELVFDYLKDRLAVTGCTTRLHLEAKRLAQGRAQTGQLLLRGLHYAIVDEADSVLVDEARTPLIIAGCGNDDYERQVYEQALEVSRQLRAGQDFGVDLRERSIRLTPEGESRAAMFSEPLGGLWKGRRRRLEFVRQALTALHLFHRDKQYVVQNEKVQIVDEYTGRVMPDRSWERGLHQMIEVKETCPLGRRQETLARISYQRFFRRYLRLAGMTGTVREVAGELWEVYRLGVVRVPTNRPMQRRGRGERVYASSAERWRSVVQTISTLHAENRPILVGTRSVAASEQLGVMLDQAGLSYRLLNARHDQAEAEIIAEAGCSGRITVATNMAGRGTDIKLPFDVVKNGGLHVIATERHDARRIDRQLFGRCGRQGDPGTYEAVVSLEDELVASHVRAIWRFLAALLLACGIGTPARILMRRAQRSAEHMHRKMRNAVLKADEQSETILGFAGKFE